MPTVRSLNEPDGDDGYAAIGRIGFTGPFADINFGDYAMVINNIADLGWPSVTLFTYNEDFLRTVVTDYLSDVDTALVRVGIDEAKCHKYREFYPFTMPEVFDLAENIETIRSEVRRLRVMVVNGGGYFNDLWAMPHRIGRLLSIMLPALVAVEQGVPVVFTGNGYGPFSSSAQLHSEFFAAMGDACLGARDGFHSPNWMSGIGVDRKQIMEIPDDLLLLNVELRNRTARLQAPSRPYIVFETYEPVENLFGEIDGIRRACRQLEQVHKMKILFVPFNLGAGGIDQAEYLASEIPGLTFLDIRQIGYLPIEDASRILANAEFVISSRYHAQVLALASQTPSMSVLRPVHGDRRYYYNKNVGLLRQVLGVGSFRESDFVSLDLCSALEAVAKDFPRLAARQCTSFSGDMGLRLEELAVCRREILHERILKPGAGILR